MGFIYFFLPEPKMILFLFGSHSERRCTLRARTSPKPTLFSLNLLIDNNYLRINVGCFEMSICPKTVVRFFFFFTALNVYRRISVNIENNSNDIFAKFAVTLYISI